MTYGECFFSQHSFPVMTLVYLRENIFYDTVMAVLFQVHL